MTDQNNIQYIPVVNKQENTMSDEIKDLAAALSKAQGEMKNANLNKENPYFKSKYADLPTILDAVCVPLNESGLVISQNPNGKNLETVIFHVESGEYISSSIEMSCKDWTNPQAVGSAITYFRRYSICAMLNLNIDTDDDGNNATPRNKPVLQVDTPVYAAAVKHIAKGGLWEVITDKYVVTNEVKIDIEIDAAKYNDPPNMSQTDIKNKVGEIGK